MEHVQTRTHFSPSDVTHFLECEHLIRLQLQSVQPATTSRDPYADLLAAKGAEHERAWLEHFRSDSRKVVEIASPPGEREWAHDAARTLDAMRAGADVIYQGVLVEDDWRGAN